MKKLFIALIISCAGLVAYGQAKSALVETAATGTIYGKTATTTTFSTKLNQEYDYSYQIIPATSGAGDSLNSAVALWVSNTHAGTSWTEVTTARDTITGTGGILVEGTDAKNMRHRIVLTGTVLDTSTFTIYPVYKLDRRFR